MTRCKAITKKGLRCKYDGFVDGYCVTHTEWPKKSKENSTQRRSKRIPFTSSRMSYTMEPLGNSPASKKNGSN